MSTAAPRARRRTSSRLLAVVTTLLVAVSGLFVVPTVAHAAEGDVTNASLDWGVKEGWRNYIAGMVAGPNPGGGTFFTAPASATPAPYNWGTAGIGSYDETTQTGSFTAQGGIRWTFPSHGIDVTLSDLVVAFDLSSGTGTITGTYVDPVRAVPTTTKTMVTFAIGSSNVAGGVVTVSGATATAAEGTEEAFGSYPVGTPMDPVSFSFNYEQALAATSTSLSVLPNGTVDVNTEVTLTATVTPGTVPGTVTFFDGTEELGTEIVSGGGASISTSALAVGEHSITATFTPEAGQLYLPSTSDASLVTVEIPDTAVATTTTVSAPTPAAPVALSSPVALSATVAADSGTPTGTVDFYSVAAGTTERVLLGNGTVDEEGIATLNTSALPQGGFTFAAVYRPANQADFITSEGTTTANYNVVDITPAAHCTVPSGTVTSPDTASASWGWSQYFIDMTFFNPVRTGTGDVTVSGTNHVFSDGVVRATADCAEITFEGTARLTLHGGTNWVEIEDPTIFIAADGSAVWQAVVRSWSAGNTFESDGPVTVATGSAGASFAPGDSVDTALNFGFAGTVPQGTWHASYTDAWSNPFVWALDPDQRAYYTRTGTSAANGNKGALPLNVDFTWPAISSTTLAVSPAAPQVLGNETTLTATVAPVASTEGTVEFFGTSAVTGTEVSLGEAGTVNGVATLPVTLAAGGHTFRAEFTSSNAYSDSESTATANYGVVDPAQPAACTPTAEESETLTGVAARWAWSAYGNSPAHTGGGINWPKFGGGNISVDGADFVLSGGTATVSEDCASIAFTGTMRVEAYQSFFPTHGQWIELVDPVLTIDAAGNGAWSAGVRAGTGALNENTSARTVIAAVSGADFPGLDVDSFGIEAPLAYEGTTAAGSWAVKDGTAFEDAWSNAFVLQVPSAIRSFYYASGAAGDPNKAPEPISLSWQLADPIAQIDGLATVEQGQKIEFSGRQFRAGASVGVEIHSDPVVLAPVTAGFDGVARASWTVPTDFALGEHEVIFTDEFGRTASAGFTVIAATSGSGSSGQSVCVARAVTGGSLQWGLKESFRSYVQGPIANGTFSGGSFAASGGAFNVVDGGIGRANFSGAITATGHGGLLNFQLSNPSVQITGPGTGVLFAHVSSTSTSGAAAVNGVVAFANLSFSGPAIGGDALSVSGASATLTAAGAQAFAGFYPAGTALDPVSFSVSLGGEVPCDATTDPVELAKTGSNGDMSIALLSIAGLALLLGFGALRLRRSRELA